MNNFILQTKLYIPPLPAGFVARPRLIERLDEGLRQSHRLTLISAPAGFGKTTLVSEWIESSDQLIAWLSLDDGDNDPARFWAYFIASLQTIFEDVGEAALAALQSPQPPPFETFITDLINEIAAIPDPSPKSSVPGFSLVLDDFHVITNRQINDALAFLLQNMPSQMHLVLSGRADPLLPLARLRGRGQLTEIRAADLRFIPDEAVAFLNDVMGLGLSAEDITALDARTEGWIAGLQMAALSMRERKDVSGFIKSFSGSHRFILDYLVDEVLDHQSSDIQEFLLMTSILERMTGPLCNAVTDRDDSQVILVQLEQANLFLIPLDDERRWYRYHHLFADLLRSRLEQNQPDQLLTLYRHASEWYEQNVSLSEAVGYALAANDIERVARLVARNALAMIYHEELRTLVRWLDAIPDEAVRSRPWLCITHAWTLAHAGKFNTVERLLQDAGKALADSDEPTEGQRIVGHIAAIRAYAAALRGEKSHAAELARDALEHLPISDLMVRGYTTTLLGTVLRDSGDLAGAAKASAKAIAISHATGDSHLAADILCDLAALQFLQGKLHKAAATCRDAQQIADEYTKQGGRPLPVMGYAYMRLSDLLREWNDLGAAMHYAREGLEICRQWGQADVLVYSYSEVAKVLQAIGDADGALDAIRESKRIANNVSLWPGIYVAGKQARLWLAQGNLEAASRWAQDSGLSINDKLSFQHLFRYIILARVLIAQGTFDKAMELLVRLLKAVESAGAMFYAVEILILQAITLQAQDEIGQALTTLKRALSLAEPEGYVRIFIDEGEPMGELLRQAAARGISVDYVGRLLAALDKETKDEPRVMGPTPSPLIEPLSERELEVLRLLATGLSTSEIVQELFVAISTLRSHTKSIYRKLDVHSRHEAVARAKELNLI